MSGLQLSLAKMEKNRYQIVPTESTKGMRYRVMDREQGDVIHTSLISYRRTAVFIRRYCIGQFTTKQIDKLIPTLDRVYTQPKIKPIYYSHKYPRYLTDQMGIRIDKQLYNTILLDYISPILFADVR